MHGYQIIQELAERTGGVWRPSPGSVYPTLQQLEDEDLVRETASDSGKRVYELTDAGREQAAAAPAPWTAVADESDDALVALRDLAFQVLAATRQVAKPARRRSSRPRRRAPRRAPQPVPAPRRGGRVEGRGAVAPRPSRLSVDRVLRPEDAVRVDVRADLREPVVGPARIERARVDVPLGEVEVRAA